jgi:hypothetical protein
MSHSALGTDPPVRRISVVVISLAVVASALAAGAAAGEIRFEYRFRPETIYDQTIDMKLSISMEMAGGIPDEQSATANALTQGMSQEMVMKLAMALGPLGGDGTMPVEIRLDDMKAAMVVAGQRMETPSSVQPGSSLMSGRITPGGRLTDLRMEGEESIPSELMDRILQFIPPMPEADLAIGDHFDVPMKMAVPLPGADMEMEGKAVYTLKSISGSEAAFDLTQSFSVGLDGDEGAEIAGMSMKMQGGGTGTAIFDVEEGIFSRIEFDMEMSATVDGTPQAGSEGGEEAAPAGPLSIRMKAAGPIVMTIARRSTGT